MHLYITMNNEAQQFIALMVVNRKFSETCSAKFGTEEFKEV